LAAADHAVGAGKDRRVGGRVDDPIGTRQNLDVTGVADVAVPDFDAEPEQIGAIQVRAGPDQVIDAKNLVLGGGAQFPGKRGADETANAGDEKSHGQNSEALRLR
jgi:hypothetical protein